MAEPAEPGAVMGYFDDLTPDSISGFALGDGDLLGLPRLGGLDPYGLTRTDAARPAAPHVTDAGATAFRQSLHGSLAQQKRAELADYLKQLPADNKVMRPPADAGKRAPPQARPAPSSKAGLDAAWRDAIRESDAGQPRRARPSMLRDDVPDLLMTDEQARGVFPAAPPPVRIPYADPRRDIAIITDTLDGVAAKVARLSDGTVFVVDGLIYRKGAGKDRQGNPAGDWRDIATSLSRPELTKLIGPVEMKRLDRRMALRWKQDERMHLARLEGRSADRAMPSLSVPPGETPGQLAVRMLVGGNRRQFPVVPDIKAELAASLAESRRLTPAERKDWQRKQDARKEWIRQAMVAEADPRSMVAKKWAQNLPQRAKTWLGGLMEWGAESNRQYQNFTHLGADLIYDTSALRDAQYQRDVAWARRLRREGVEAIEANAPKFGSEVDRYAYEIGNGVVDLVAALGITALTRSPTAGSALLSAQVWGDRYGRSREDGRTHGQATMDAAVYSVAEFIPERLAIGRILRPGGTVAGRVVGGGTAQSIQETVTTAIQMGYDVGILKEDMSWGDALRRLKDAAIIGGGTGGIVSGAVAPFRRSGSGQPITGDRINRGAAAPIVEHGIASSLDDVNAPPAVPMEPGQSESGPPTVVAGDPAGQPSPSVSIEGGQTVIRGASSGMIAEIEAGLSGSARALRRSDGAFVLPKRDAEGARSAIELILRRPADQSSGMDTDGVGQSPRHWLDNGGEGGSVPLTDRVGLSSIGIGFDPTRHGDAALPPFELGGGSTRGKGVDVGGQYGRTLLDEGQAASSPLDRQTVGDLSVGGGRVEAGDGRHNADPIATQNAEATDGAPLLLTYARTTQALEQALRQKAPQRWRDSEQYIIQSYGAEGQRYFPVPEAIVNDEKIKGKGGRYVDASVDTRNGGVLAIEVKTYRKWRTIDGQPTRQYVPLSGEIRLQILKDIWLRDNNKNYDPRWIFVDAEPSSDLLNFLNENKIISISYKR